MARLQARNSRKEMTTLYNVQVDGPISVPSSYESTPQTSPQPFRKMSETDPAFLDLKENYEDSEATDSWDYSYLSPFSDNILPDYGSHFSLEDSYITGSIDNYPPALQSTLSNKFTMSLPNLSCNKFDDYVRSYPHVQSSPSGPFSFKREDANH